MAGSFGDLEAEGECSPRWEVIMATSLLCGGADVVIVGYSKVLEEVRGVVGKLMG